MRNERTCNERKKKGPRSTLTFCFSRRTGYVCRWFLSVEGCWMEWKEWRWLWWVCKYVTSG